MEPRPTEELIDMLASSTGTRSKIRKATKSAQVTELEAVSDKTAQARSSEQAQLVSSGTNRRPKIGKITQAEKDFGNNSIQRSLSFDSKIDHLLLLESSEMNQPANLKGKVEDQYRETSTGIDTGRKSDNEEIMNSVAVMMRQQQEFLSNCMQEMKMEVMTLNNRLREVEQRPNRTPQNYLGNQEIQREQHSTFPIEREMRRSVDLERWHLKKKKLKKSLMKNLRESLSELTTKQLQELLRKYGLPHWYNLKVNLIDRLEKFMENSEKNWKSELKNNEITLNTEEKLVNVNNNNTIESDAADGETLNMSSEPVQNNINFKEVEESLELFDGESNKKIEDWLLDFESISVVCKWNQVQRFLYCKRLLRGAAKLAVEAETGVNSWEILKRTLRTEFGCQESENLHKKLENTKKLSNESFLEYFYKMKKVASRGTVEETHLIEYIIAGIPDSSLNKATLYQSCSLEQLKINLKAYEKFKADQEKEKRCQGRNNYDNYYSGNQVNKRCNNSGAVSHTTQHCPDRGRGRRCFK
ncbi:uncharacterized protein LOC119667437 [Teleopsis dalmanni]|uniref:uncharacterized protein LOC119667437 n=1 Tax=Teleopsis dalmanni TaxID=139649 RepID=UPI0018CE2A0B|nr:uncharacterized protein LOC119667437 [Teleopsis dalmanni]